MKRRTKCKHNHKGFDLFVQYNRDGEACDHTKTHAEEPVSWRCAMCGDYASLGDARIASEDAEWIAIELRAAELASQYALYGLDSGTPDEKAGRLCHSYQAEHEHDETAPYLAGWLAREIATEHDV